MDNLVGKCLLYLYSVTLTGFACFQRVEELGLLHCTAYEK